MTDHLSNFIDAMKAAGAAPERASDIKETPPGTWGRYQIDGDRKGSKNGSYRLSIDGDFAMGSFCDHKIGETQSWHSKTTGKSNLSSQEREALKAKIEAKREQAEAERAAEQVNVARAAKLVWDKSGLATAAHPYLRKKGVGPHGLRLSEDNHLLVPMYGDGKLWAYQTIAADGTKLYLEGARKQGCYYPLTTVDESKERIILVEGFATGASIREATGLPTVICFDAGNLLPVAMAMKAKYPAAQFIIAADADNYTFREPRHPDVKGLKRHDIPGDDPRWAEWRKAGYLTNPGQEKALQASARIGGAHVLPPELPLDHPDKPSDYNDLHKLYGLAAVKDRLLSVPKPVVPVKKKHVDDGSWWDALLTRKLGQDGRERFLEENSLNYSMIVRNHPALEGVFAWDEFHCCTMVVKCPPWTKAEEREHLFEVHPLDEADGRECDYWIQTLGFHLKGSIPKTEAAIHDAALRNKIHPARDYFDSLEWDAEPRLDNWLIDYVGAENDDPDYVRAVGRTWLMAAVKRVYQPGCKFDHMLILEGPQSAGKSTTLKIMATFGDGEEERSYFLDTLKIANCDNTDELLKVSGRLIVEIQEMAGFTRKDNESLKAFITSTIDTYREPYGRKVKDWPRQFVLAGTYNPIDGIFTDPTGLRRYWVVATGKKIDLEGLRKARRQIWAEAVARYKAGEGIVLSDAINGKAEVAAGARRIVDDMTPDVLRCIRGRAWFEVRDVLKALEIPVKGRSQGESRAISKILRVEGFERVQKSVAGRPTWGWSPPDGTVVQFELPEEPATLPAYYEEETEIAF